MPRINKHGSLLILIVILAAIIRLYGVGFGLPDLMHTDEARIILDSMSMGQRMSLLPQDVNYPLFYKYVLLVSYGGYYTLGLLFGFFKDKTDFAVKFLLDQSNIVLLSRIVTTLLGTITVVVAYYWGVLIDRSRRTGLVAAVFTALEWQLVLESQYALHQTLAALSSLVAFLGLSLVLVSKSRKSYIVGGVALGFAAASHQSVVLLLPTLIYVFSTDLSKNDNIRPREAITNWLNFCFPALLIGIMGNLNWMFRFKESLHFFLQGTGAGRVAFSSMQYFSYDIPSIVSWYLAEIIRRDYLIGLFVSLSLIVAILRRKKLDILYLIVTVTYFVFFYRWAFRWMHLFVGLIPIAMLFAAKCLSDLISRLRVSNIAVVMSVFLIISPNIFDLVRMDLNKHRPETRQLAKQWIEQNIPKGTKVAIDYPAHAVSLDTKYPNILRNRIAQDYFENTVPQAIKDKYLQLNDLGMIYEVVDMIDSKSKPEWPDFMPREAIQKAESSATMKDIYAYFNFKPVDKIVAEGARYIVLTSYTYAMFLYSDDPRKIYMANSYIKDDVLPFFNHGHTIDAGTQHELMYYVAKRGRDYFSQLLDNKIPGIKLIKEFVPSADQYGPVVKIYSVLQNK